MECSLVVDVNRGGKGSEEWEGGEKRINSLGWGFMGEEHQAGGGRLGAGGGLSGMSINSFEENCLSGNLDFLFQTKRFVKVENEVCLELHGCFLEGGWGRTKFGMTIRLKNVKNKIIF